MCTCVCNCKQLSFLVRNWRGNGYPTLACILFGVPNAGLTQLLRLIRNIDDTFTHAPRYPLLIFHDDEIAQSTMSELQATTARPLEFALVHLQGEYDDAPLHSHTLTDRGSPPHSLTLTGGWEGFAGQYRISSSRLSSNPPCDTRTSSSTIATCNATRPHPIPGPSLARGGSGSVCRLRTGLRTGRRWDARQVQILRHPAIPPGGTLRTHSHSQQGHTRALTHTAVRRASPVEEPHLNCHTGSTRKRY